MNMPVDIGFHLRPSFEKVPKGIRILQSTVKIFLIASQSGIVMGENESGFFGMPVQHATQPGKLLVSEQSLRDIRSLERIEKEEIYLGERNHAQMLRYHGRFRGPLRFHYFVEDVAVVVVPQGEMDRNIRVTQRRDEFCEVLVVACLAIIQGKIAVDDYGRRMTLLPHQSRHRLAQVRRNRRVRRMVFANVRIVENGDTVRID